ncbi:MAG: DUF4037 domain-containing protein, partial [Clostridia bacterium]|nr:DUF4037 domain-containing protein [Clostridia bacterium]
MAEFVKGMTLCEGFFHDCAEGILTDCFPDLVYSAGLIGYGSDVLGYDDPVSTDHMWGPRFYLFLRESDICRKEEIMDALSVRLPCTYRGYSVNFTAPDENDNGVRHPEYVETGPVHPLIWIRTFGEFLTGQIGTADPDTLTPCGWLSLSEHRLLSLVSGKFFTDGLDCAAILEKLRYYPRPVRLYLIASAWDIIASEQAFLRRTGDVGDDIGSRLICGRIGERLMRLCFLYKGVYAPYSKWFGTAFGKLGIDPAIGQSIREALSADDVVLREEKLIRAMALTAQMHNDSGLAAPVPLHHAVAQILFQ